MPSGEIADKTRDSLNGKPLRAATAGSRDNGSGKESRAIHVTWEEHLGHERDLLIFGFSDAQKHRRGHAQQVRFGPG